MYQANDYQWARPYLDADEHILWRGAPEKLHLLSLPDVYLIPFSLLWAGFAVFWEYSALRSGAPSFFLVFGGFFVLIGLYITVGRFIWRAVCLKGASYVITEKKVLLRRRGRIEMLMKNSLPPVTVKSHRDGTGTVLLSSPPSMFQRNYVSRSSFQPALELHGIADPDAAMRALQRGAYGQDPGL
ncbi:MAG: hypothetical protein IK095_10070 [Oscillospiraceae bacterium]|nr:hypothetical protein [Oscillospiraceae bacterium]